MQLSKPYVNLYLFLVVGLFLTFKSADSQAFFIDGEGHYALRGATETAPGFSGTRGMNESIKQSFRLLTEIRPSDKTSMFLEFRLFPDSRTSYLGDTARPQSCSKSKNSNTGSASDCEGRQQETDQPQYANYSPTVSQAYGRFASDFCILEAGRRPRDWGMGIFLNSGKQPFDTGSSNFDGVGCTLNIQKSQTLGFSVGYDKLAETGAKNELLPEETSYTPGAYTRQDDLSQIYFTIEYDDRAANAGSSFTRHVGFYVGNISGPAYSTDIKYADLFTGFYFRSLVIRNEVLFRLGKSGDASWTRLGGRSPDPTPETAADLNSSKKSVTKNDVQSIAVAGDIEYTLSKSGAFAGPAEYAQGNFQRHSLKLEYAYAPGDRDGYRTEYDDEKSVNAISQRNSKVTAIALHRNYKPTLLLFSDTKELEDLRVDGIYDPARIMNATVAALSYRYENTIFGNFESKIATAILSEGIPADVKESFKDAEVKPIGYGGNSLGIELDLKYDRSFGKDLNVGVTTAFAMPGPAWDVEKGRSKRSNFLLQSHLAFNF